MRPAPADCIINQGFGGLATGGVVGNLYGSTVEVLVALYGNYQEFGHAGADLLCPIGTPVYAMLDGVVVWADWGYNLPGDNSWGPNGYFKRWGLYKDFPGICTVIWHPQINKFSIYGHLSSNDMAPVGTWVEGGQQIALSGNTKTRGEYVGPHLHVAMLADHTNYRTGNGLIYGCEDPVPYFGSGSLSYASESITPSEDEMSADMPMKSKDGAEVTLEIAINSIDTKAEQIREAVKGLPKFDEQVREQFDIQRALERDLRADLAHKGAQIDGLTAAVTALAGQQSGVTTEEVLAAIESAAAKFAAGYKLTLQPVEQEAAQ